MRKALKFVIDKYRKSPEFRTLEVMDVNQQGMTGNTLLHVAAVSEAPDDIRVLVKAGAQVNARGEFGETPLHKVSVRGHRKSVISLLRWGADPAIRNNFGETALELAELMGRTEVVRILRTHSGRRP
jgi:ankyrin repeat protein